MRFHSAQRTFLRRQSAVTGYNSSGAQAGAFADYGSRQDLFPSSRFRLADDVLTAQQPERAAKEYLGILSLAARQSEVAVEAAWVRLLDAGVPLSAGLVAAALERSDSVLSVTAVTVAQVAQAS